MKSVYTLFFAIVLFSSCVSKKKFAEQSGTIQQMQMESEALENKLNAAVEANAGLEAKADFFGKQNASLLNDTSSLGQALRAKNRENKDLNKLNEDLVNQNKKLLSTSIAQQQKLLSELEKQKREVSAKNAALNEKEKTLKNQQEKTDKLQAAIEEKEAIIKVL